MKKQYVSQGDLNFYPTTKPIPAGAKLRESRVLAYGEATGHSHVLVGDAEVYEMEDSLLIVTKEGEVRVEHNTHAPQILAPNTKYEMPIDREYDYFSEKERPVND